jgi:hypothetical protein
MDPRTTPPTPRPFDAQQLEYGVRWPDGRVVPTPASELAYWEHNTALDIVVRTVTVWKTAAKLPIAA